MIEEAREWGHSLMWSNPHTEPPTGMPKIIGEVFDGERRRSTSTEREILDQWPVNAPFDYALGCGYGWHLLMPVTQRKTWSDDTKASARKKRAVTKIKKEYPLFEVEFIERLDE